jgi:hypothetical protein
MTNQDKTQQAMEVSFKEHNDLIHRICSSIAAFFEPTRVTVQEIDLPDDVLNRSAAEVLAFLPQADTAQPCSNSPQQHNTARFEPDEEEELTTTY